MKQGCGRRRSEAHNSRVHCVTAAPSTMHFLGSPPFADLQPVYLRGREGDGGGSARARHDTKAREGRVLNPDACGIESKRRSKRGTCVGFHALPKAPSWRSAL